MIRFCVGQYTSAFPQSVYSDLSGSVHPRGGLGCQPGAESAEAKKLNAGVMADDDPGPKYAIGAWYSFCGRPDLAYPALQQAIAQNYCAYPEMETDPLLAKLRATPKFAEIRSSGIACQQHFLEHRKQSDSK